MARVPGNPNPCSCYPSPTQCRIWLWLSQTLLRFLSLIAVTLTLFFILNTAYNTTEHFYRSRKIYYVLAQGQVTWLQRTYSPHRGDFCWKWLPRDSPSAPQDGEGLSCFLQHRGYPPSSCMVLLNPHPSAGQIAFFSSLGVSVSFIMAVSNVPLDTAQLLCLVPMLECPGMMPGANLGAAGTEHHESLCCTWRSRRDPGSNLIRCPTRQVER